MACDKYFEFIAKLMVLVLFLNISIKLSGKIFKLVISCVFFKIYHVKIMFVPKILYCK